MPYNKITKADVSDVDFVDSYELISDAYGPNSIYLTTACVSTSYFTNIITVGYGPDGEGILYGSDHPAQSGDIVILYGTSGADGYYTINTVLTDTSFSVNENINTSTDGYVEYHYPSGASRVGFGLDLYQAVHITHNNVQGALQDLDIAITHSNYITKQIEIDFGTSPTNYKTFTVYDSDVTVSSLIFPTQAGNAPTGRSADENEMDPIIFSAVPDTGKFLLIASSKDGPVVGNYKVNYGIG
jgi:hypothetical protein